MKKVLHITNYYYPHIGGIETATRDIVNVLKSTNQYEQRVICFGDGPNIVDDVRIIRLRYLIKIRSQAISFKYKRVLKKTINTFNPDIVLIHTPNPLIEHYFNCCKFKGVVLVYHHLDIMRQKFLKLFFKHTQNTLKKRANYIICHSKQYIDSSAELRDFKDKCLIIPLCYKEKDFELDSEHQIEVNNIRKRYQGKTLLFFSGRHTKTKGLHLALKAVKNMSGILFLVGRVGEVNRRLERKIDRSGPNVIYLGQLDRHQYVSYLNACDFYLFPSLTKNEAFPITLIEVIALGKSPVTFTIPGSGVGYISKNGVTGIECKNGDVLAFRDAIMQLKSDVKLRNKYHDEGIKRAKELFNHDIFSKSFLNLFNEINTKTK